MSLMRQQTLTRFLDAAGLANGDAGLDVASQISQGLIAAWSGEAVPGLAVTPDGTIDFLPMRLFPNAAGRDALIAELVAAGYETLSLMATPSA